MLKEEDLPLDEILDHYANKKDSYQEIIVIILNGEGEEGFIGVGTLFEKGALCLIEAETDNRPSFFAKTFFTLGKAHLELSIPEMGELIELFLKNPEELKTFFNPRNQIARDALSKLFEEHGLDINTFKHSFIFEGVLKQISSKLSD
ncbi:hypothetical protein OAK75_05895, partial [Bacteriovoracales bacterium]|nr:hypothetical protein [Bacteriovoracales bacterium]